MSEELGFMEFFYALDVETADRVAEATGGKVVKLIRVERLVRVSTVNQIA